jgi:hypothetical protein
MFFPNEIWLIIKEYVGIGLSDNYKMAKELNRLKQRSLMNLINCTFLCQVPKRRPLDITKIEFKNTLIKLFMFYFKQNKSKQKKIYNEMHKIITIWNREQYVKQYHCLAYARDNYFNLQIQNTIYIKEICAKKNFKYNFN